MSDDSVAEGHHEVPDTNGDSRRKSTAFGLSRSAYIVRRLGIRGDDLRSLDNRQKAGFLLSRMFLRAFTAPTFAQFWRYWNPVYGYYLGKYVYRPCRRILPRSLCVLATFVFCGFFLHDILGWPAYAARSGQLAPPHSITAWFAIIGLGIVISEKLELRFDGLAAGLRVMLHVGYLTAAYLLSRMLV